jgi:hypothetical protein
MAIADGDWTYADPALSDAESVRFYVGATDPANKDLSDQEIDFALSIRNSDPLRAAIVCAAALAGRFARESTYRIGQVSETFKQKSEAYERREAGLRRMLALSGGDGPYAGGISVADVETQEADSDRVVGQFSLGMHDNT